MRRLHSRLYSALFLLPFAGYWMSYVTGHAVPDPLGNRYLAKLPPAEHGVPSSSWLQQAALWTIEQSPFRYRTIQARNALLLSAGNRLFPIPVNPGHPEVSLGKDGWLFLLNETPASRSKKDLRDIAKRAMKIARLVHSSGRKFYFVIFPDKMSIYPEYSGWTKKWAERYAGRQMLPDIMASAWEKAPDMRGGYIPMRQPILEAKAQSRDLLYWELDTHWTDAGALAATRALVNGIQPGLFEESSVHSGGLHEEGEFDLQSEFLLQDAVRKGPRYTIHREKEPSAVTTRDIADPRYGPGMILHCTSPLKRVVKGRTLIIGDSYTTTAFSLISPWFEDLTFFHHGSIGTPELAAALRDCDTLIWATVERGLTERLRLWTGSYYYNGYFSPALTPRTAPPSDDPKSGTH